MDLYYSRTASPSGLSDVIDKLATFANARGWTVELQAGRAWTEIGSTGVYEWSVDSNEDFLEIQSNGYGSQDLIYRFRRVYIDSTEDTLWYKAIEPGTSYSTGDSLHPCMQDAWNDGAGYQTNFFKMSCPNITTPDVWFVGNDKFIAVHWKVAATYVPAFALGTIDLIPEFQDTDELNFFWPGQNFRDIVADRNWADAVTYPLYWWSPYGYQCFLSTYGGIPWFYHNGAGGSYDTVMKNNVRYHQAAYDDDPGDPVGGKIYFNVLHHCAVYNSFSQKRTLVRQTNYLQQGGGTFVAIGHTPVYFINFEGLAPGDIINFSSEDYICFPAFFTNNVYGVAYKVII